MKKRMIAIFGSVLLVAISAGPSPADHHAINISVKDGLGRYLTDAHGKTLYWFKMDSDGQSACSGGCLEKWPIYYREKVLPPTDVNAGDFGTITRTDGSKQTTFRGFPLYYFFKDSKPGDTMGQGIKNVWFVIDPQKFPPE
jgi:predicted lipoprotein with Yx(FWY)xxD motif